MSSVEEYDALTLKKRLEFCRQLYEKRNGKSLGATSYDVYFRELEIQFIIDNVWDGAKILDVGCGNGYSDFMLAMVRDVEIVGIDFSPAMIDGANHLRKLFEENMLGRTTFILQDICEMIFEAESFDIVISERGLLNLPNRESQLQAIEKIFYILKPGGRYIMIEGTREGLQSLNDMRTALGLSAILDRGPNNVTSLKFNEAEIETFLAPMFETVKKQHFGMYYLISRVVHPLLVAPEGPEYCAKINEIACQVARLFSDYRNLGHVCAYVLGKLPI